MKRPRIVSLGEVLWDVYADQQRFGGAPANFACHAARCDSDVSMVSAVGDDDLGVRALSTLRDKGVDADLVQVVAKVATGAVGVEVDDLGKPTYKISNDAAWDCVDWNDGIGRAIRSADFVYFGTLGQRSATSRQTIRRAVQVAKSENIPRVLDINLRADFYDDVLIRESVEQATILKLSDEELPAIARAFGFDAPSVAAPSERVQSLLRQILETVVLDLVVMTRGADGAIAVSGESIASHPGVSVDVQDTVGAGDAFTARLVAEIWRGTPLETMLHQACEYAAEICCISGAVPE